MKQYLVLFPFLFWIPSHLSAENIPHLFPIPIGDTCRYIDEEGNFQFKTYWKCAPFESELTTVKKKDYNYMIIDANGREIRNLPNYYQYGSIKNGLIRIQKDGYYGFMDASGTIVIPAKYYRLNFESEGKIAYCKWNRRSSVNNIRCGYMNLKEEMLIGENFTAVEDFQNGVASVSEDYSKKFQIDAEGKEIKLSERDYDSCPLKDGYTPVRVERNGKTKVHYVNNRGETKIPNLDFIQAAPFSEGYAFFFKKGVMGIFDLNFKVLWSKPMPASEEDFKIYEDLNPVPPSVDSQRILCNSNYYIFESGYAIIDNYGKDLGYQYVDSKGEILGERTFTKAKAFRNGFARVEFMEQEKVYLGILNTKGNIIYKKEKPIFEN